MDVGSPWPGKRLGIFCCAGYRRVTGGMPKCGADGRFGDMADNCRTQNFNRIPALFSQDFQKLFL